MGVVANYFQVEKVSGPKYKIAFPNNGSLTFLSAKEYLQGRMKNLELLGLDMKWVHETLVKSGLWDEVITAEMAKVPLEEREWMDYD
jgi:hypothetical protein